MVCFSLSTGFDGIPRRKKPSNLTKVEVVVEIPKLPVNAEDLLVAGVSAIIRLNKKNIRDCVCVKTYWKCLSWM